MRRKARSRSRIQATGSADMGSVSGVAASSRCNFPHETQQLHWLSSRLFGRRHGRLRRARFGS